ncbi:MAG: diacylglycerol kinase family lipid kinase [Bacteroidales bacterium]|nr:diacylglycerol kinase family lipid kinase [Bacteroidales bacterium]
MTKKVIRDTTSDLEKENPPRYVFIINPIAGGKKKSRIEKVISENFSPVEAIIKYTRKQGHAYKIARRFVRKGSQYCIAVGGDGTVNEVATALVNTNTTLGIVPAGSGNGLSNDLKIPRITGRAIQLIRQHSVHTVDVGKLNDRYFFCTCGIGFDARVGYEFARNKKRGIHGYVRSVFRQFIQYRPKKYRVSVDGQKHKIKAFLITIANAGQYGNNVYIAPGARIDDGLLDICIVKPFPKAKALDIGLKLVGKKIDRSPYLEVIRGKKVTLRGKKKKQCIHYDGEPLVVKGKINIQIQPGALKVMVPKVSSKKVRHEKPVS